MAKRVLSQVVRGPDSDDVDQDSQATNQSAYEAFRSVEDLSVVARDFYKAAGT